MSSKDKLINATIEAIFTEGLYGVTTAKIAEKAELSEAMIYKHFKNKSQMIIQTFLGIKAELNQFIESKIAGEKDFEAICYKIWLANVDYFVQNSKKLRVLNQVEHSNFMSDDIRSECLNMSRSVMTFFKSGIEQNIFKDMHAEVAIALFFSPILSIAESIIEKRIDRSEQILNMCFESTMDAMKICHK